MGSNSGESSFEQVEGKRPIVYALLWRANESGPHIMQEFEKRIPRLMGWLKELKKNGNLVACGGGAFDSAEGISGGLTLVRANSFDHARELSSGTPMNEIGKTEIMIWDLFHANLQENIDWQSKV
jgi:hypothetical protein